MPEERSGREAADAAAPARRRRRRAALARRHTGITLVELMVIVAIIAIIAAIAITLYQDVVKKSKLAADHGTVASMRSAVAIYYGKNNGSFPTTRGEVNTLITPAPVFQCSVLPVYEPGNGKITFTAVLSDCP